MSRYPDGMQSGRDVEVDLKCQNCGHCWEVPGRHDLGTTELIDEDDAECPVCGAWGE